MADLSYEEYRADFDDVKGRLANLDEKVEKILALVVAIAEALADDEDEHKEETSEEEKKDEHDEHKEEKHEEEDKKPQVIRFI